jgi:hypothetical protein
MSEPARSGIQDAANQVQRVACGTGRGIGEVRAVIRAQPIAAALVVLGLGYMFGRLGSLIPSRHRSARRP